MLTNDEIENIIGNYENTRELTDLIRKMQEERVILKAAIANLIDSDIGSVHGWTEQREVPMLMNRMNVSDTMARIMLTACDETLASPLKYDPI